MQPNPSIPAERFQELVEQYCQVLKQQRQTENTEPLTDQLCGFVDLIKGMVERGEKPQTLNALDQLKELFLLIRDQLDYKAPKFADTSAELVAYAREHNLPVPAALLEAQCQH